MKNLNSFTVTIKNLAELTIFAQSIAKVLEAGDVLALTGTLGAGKTTFTRALVQALEGNELLVSSPTFSLLHEYSARIPVYHFDSYRLEGINDFIDSGFEEYLYADGVCIIEWANVIESILPSRTICLEIGLPQTYQSTVREFIISNLDTNDVSGYSKLQQISDSLVNTSLKLNRIR